MTPNLAVELIVFGGLLTTATLALVNFFPEIGRSNLLTGAVGGGVCLVLGLRGLIVRRGQKAAKVTLVLMTIFSAIRTVSAWTRFFSSSTEPMEAVWYTVLLLFSASLLTMFRQEGI